MKKIIVVLIASVICILLAIAFIFILFPRKYRIQIEYYSAKYDLPEYLIASVINIESGYNPNAVSSVGAKGLMQIMDSTAEECKVKLGWKEDLDIFDIENN